MEQLPPPLGQGLVIVENSRSLRHTSLGWTSLVEWSARRRDLYLTTHNTLKRQTSMYKEGFEPAIPASKQPQNHALRQRCHRDWQAWFSMRKTNFNAKPWQKQKFMWRDPKLFLERNTLICDLFLFILQKLRLCLSFSKHRSLSIRTRNNICTVWFCFFVY